MEVDETSGDSTYYEIIEYQKDCISKEYRNEVLNRLFFLISLFTPHAVAHDEQQTRTSIT